MLRVADRPQRGQQNHGIRTVLQRHFCADGGGNNRRVAALHEAAGHDGDDRIRVGGFPRLTQLVRVPRMEGVVLGNHADNAHGKTPFNEQ